MLFDSFDTSNSIIHVNSFYKMEGVGRDMDTLIPWGIVRGTGRAVKGQICSIRRHKY